MAAGPASAVERALMSAPCSIRNMTASECPSAAAHISAVCPCHDSLALTLAPRSTSAVSAATLPVRAHVISAVSPAGEAALRQSARLQQRLDHRALPVTHAACSGDNAIAIRGRCVRAGANQQSDDLRVVVVTAQCSAVVPSGPAAFGVGLLLSSVRTAADPAASRPRSADARRRRRARAAAHGAAQRPPGGDASQESPRRSPAHLA